MKYIRKIQRIKIIALLAGLVYYAHVVLAGVVINEIVYKDGDTYDSGDWIELFNDKNEVKNISGWIIEDDDGNQFTIPPSTFINPYGFLIFYCNDKFKTVYPTVTNIIGPLPFKFGSNDTVIVRNSSGEKKNEVEYNDGQDWPEAYGNGHSIELMFPYGDNEKAYNWVQSSTSGGSPGVKNPGAVGIHVTEHDRSPDGPISSGTVNILITVKDAFATLTSVVINVNYNGENYSKTEMNSKVTDNQYDINLLPTNDGTVVRYYFDFKNDAGQTAQRFWSGTNEPYLYIVDDNPQLSGFVINEIMYNSSNLWMPDSATTSDYEYVEIYNFNNQAVDVSFWQFHDEGNKYRLPDSIIVPAGGYIVLADKTQAITDVYGPMPENAMLVSFLELGLANGGEEISWQNANGEDLNALIYDDDAPWPITPDGDGPSLELINWNFNNKLASSWLASTNFGTPGRENSVVPEPFGFLIFNFLFLICCFSKRQISNF